jgi:hypothetical protein
LSKRTNGPSSRREPTVSSRRIAGQAQITIVNLAKSAAQGDVAAVMPIAATGAVPTPAPPPRSRPATVANPADSRNGAWAVIAIGALLASFALLSATAARDKSPTFDEPLHLVGSYMHRYAHDYRINPEDPPLFGLIASLPLARGAIAVNTADPMYDQARVDVARQWQFVVDVLFGGHNDASRLTAQVRLAFVAVGVALGALIAIWAWMLGGKWAAVAATLAFALDPNFLAHSAIVKNDVLLSFTLTALALVTWRVGVRATWYWLLLLVLLCGVAVNVKFSGLLAGPIVAVMLAARALLDEPWKVLRWTLRTRIDRFEALVPIGVAALLVTWGMTWAAYGFRYAATSDGQLLDTGLIRTLARVNLYRAGNADQLPSQADVALVPSTLPMQLTKLIEDHHLLPQAWTFGFLYTYVTTLVRSSFLCGSISNLGFRWFFPLAMLFKTPLATLVAGFALAATASARGVRRWMLGTADRPIVAGGPWTVIAWGTLPAIYMASALSTNLNLGLRHVLPVYPFVFIAMGVAVAAMLRRWRRIGLIVAALLAVGLASETLCRYPNYLAFFNAAAGGPRGGVYLLSDSSLDWGQDLPAVAQWQRDHPDVLLYLCYFGIAQPGYYGIRYIAVPDRMYPAPVKFPRPGVLAISATSLQGTYTGGQLAYALGLRDEKHAPIAVLNGTIYLYQVP